MALTFIGTFLFVRVLAFFLAGWQYIPGAKGMSPVTMGINSAISVWIGFLCQYICAELFGKSIHGSYSKYFNQSPI
jgi:hypothetical protein